MMTLRGRLLLLILLVVAPTIAIEVYSQVELRGTRQAEIRQEAVRLMRLVAAEQERIDESARQLLIGFSEGQEIRSRDWARCSEAAQLVLARVEGYVNLGIATSEGDLLCSGLPSPPDKDVRRPGFLQEMAPSGNLLVGQYHVGLITGRSVLTVAVPLSQAGAAGSMLAWANIDLQWLARHFADRFNSPDLTLLIADRRGTILVRLPDNATWAGKPLGNQYSSLLNARTDGVVDTVGIDGQERIIAYSPLTTEPKGLYIGLGLSTAPYMVPIDRGTFWMAGLSFTTLLLAIIAAWYFGNVSIRRPIEKLLRAARAWQRGDLSARTALPSTGSEINDLGAAFDEMAEAVQTRDQSLEHQMQNLTHERDRAQDLAAIVEASRDAIWRWTVGGTITSWNREAERMLGYSSEEIVGKPLLTLIPADRIERAHDVISKLRQGQAYGPLETVRMHKNGTAVHVELTVSPVRDSEGRITAAATVCRDIAERKQAQAVISADLRDMTRLNQLSDRLVRQGGDFSENLNAVIDTAIAIMGAVKGNLRLLDPANGMLKLVAQRGFNSPSYLSLFTAMPLDASAYAAVIKTGQRLVVEDLRASELHLGNPAKERIKEVLLGAGVLAVIAVPLMASTGNMLGILATHFAEAHRPNRRELQLLDLLSRQVADYLERKRAEETEKTLLLELQHRNGNLLAVIQAIAQKSFSHSDIAEARKEFESRLQALARSNRQLTTSNWNSVDLEAIVRGELAMFPNRTLIEGCVVQIRPQDVQKLTLVLHELMTNAVKYGALSDPNGNVSVSWTIVRDAASPILKFKWEERGGPPVTAPTRQGMGSLLIKTSFPNARIDYGDQGLTCEIELPAVQTNAHAESSGRPGEASSRLA
jgi:PAS domain S-box-containing protein